MLCSKALLISDPLRAGGMADPDADAAPALEAIKRTYQPHTRRRKMKVPEPST